jgi:hypothetical protein
MSKGERTRIRIRVRAAMGAQAVMEGRFLGGRPPYGYRIVDLGENPNPAKPPRPTAARPRFGRDRRGSGRTHLQRIPRRTRDLAIAEGLTRDGIPCPSAHDHQRNRHRSGIAHPSTRSSTPSPTPPPTPGPTAESSPGATASSPPTAPPSTPAATPRSSASGSPRPRARSPLPRRACGNAEPAPKGSAENRSDTSSQR